MDLYISKFGLTFLCILIPLTSNEIMKWCFIQVLSIIFQCMTLILQYDGFSYKIIIGIVMREDTTFHLF